AGARERRQDRPRDRTRAAGDDEHLMLQATHAPSPTGSIAPRSGGGSGLPRDEAEAPRRRHLDFEPALLLEDVAHRVAEGALGGHDPLLDLAPPHGCTGTHAVPSHSHTAPSDPKASKSSTISSSSSSGSDQSSAARSCLPSIMPGG